MTAWMPIGDDCVPVDLEHKQLAVAFRGGQFTFGTFHIRKDGAQVWRTCRGSRTPDWYSPELIVHPEQMESE